MKSVCILLLTALCVEIAQSTDVSECILGTGVLPELVEIVDCNKSPCTFYINGETSMTMKFRSPRYLEHFRPNALALAMGINISYPLQQDDGCVGVTNTPCPLANGEYIEYTYSMFILPIFPKISFTLEFGLIDNDQNDEQVECFRLDVQLEDLPDE